MDQDPNLDSTDMDVFVGMLDTENCSGYVDSYKWSLSRSCWMPDAEFSYSESQTTDGRIYYPFRPVGTDGPDGPNNSSSGIMMDNTTKMITEKLEKTENYIIRLQENENTHASGLVSLSVGQDAAKREASIDQLRELHRRYPDNAAIALAYAKGLVNLSAEQDAAEREATIDQLRDLYHRYPDNTGLHWHMPKGCSICLPSKMR